MSALPSYRQYLLLGPGPGWSVEETASLTEDPDTGWWSLNAAPGGARPWPPILGEAIGETPERPKAMALGGDGLLYVLDAADMRIKVVDPTGAREARRIRGVGGFGGDGSGGDSSGADARRFKDAEDIAVLSRGELAVADTGHSRIKIFSPYPHALVAEWDLFDEPAHIAGGADGVLWVLDRASNRVAGVDADGVVRVELPRLTAPRALASSPAGAVAVLDAGKALVFPPSGGAPAVAGEVPGGACLAFDGKGVLYAGTGDGLIYAFAPGGQPPSVGVLGPNESVSSLLSPGGGALLALAAQPCAKAARFWRLDAAGVHVRKGSLTTISLDGGETDCVWGRIAFDADIPPGAAIEVQTECYNDPAGHGVPDLIPAPIVLTGQMRDCLAQSGPTDRGATGRYLRLSLVLRGDGLATPVLRGVRIWFPRDSLVKYLPAIYQEDDESRSFLSRYLAIMQTEFDGFDELIDDISTCFDPLATPDKLFFWLAAWLALPIEPAWTDAQRRAVLKTAGQDYRRRGTVAGLEKLISDYAGAGARLFEHFRLRQLIFLHDGPSRDTQAASGRLWSRDYYRRLQVGVYSRVGSFNLVNEPEPRAEAISWGAHEFSVLFDAEPLTMEETRKRVAAVVEREKPAHTKAHYCPVYARMRVGSQATLGIDTRIGAVSEAVLCRISTLNYDAVLAPSRAERSIKDYGAQAQSSLGVNSRLC